MRPAGLKSNLLLGFESDCETLRLIVLDQVWILFILHKSIILTKMQHSLSLLFKIIDISKLDKAVSSRKCCLCEHFLMHLISGCV